MQNIRALLKLVPEAGAQPLNRTLIVHPFLPQFTRSTVFLCAGRPAGTGRAGEEVSEALDQFLSFAIRRRLGQGEYGQLLRKRLQLLTQPRDRLRGCPGKRRGGSEVKD